VRIVRDAVDAGLPRTAGEALGISRDLGRFHRWIGETRRPPPTRLHLVGEGDNSAPRQGRKNQPLNRQTRIATPGQGADPATPRPERIWVVRAAQTYRGRR